MRGQTKMWIVSLILLLLTAQTLPVHAQEASVEDYLRPGERLVTVQPSLLHEGRIYTIHYFTTGISGRDDSRFIYVASPASFENNGVKALLVTVDGEIVTDEALMREVFILYRAAHYLYVEDMPQNLGNVDDDFAEEFRNITHNPIFIQQQIGALFSTPAEETAEALRGVLTSQMPAPSSLENFSQEIRAHAESGVTVVEAVDQTLEAARFSNSRAVRQVARDIRETFQSWESVTTQGTSYIRLEGRRIEFFNALDILSLGVRLMWLSDLESERAEWLGTYIGFATGEASLDAAQVAAVAIVRAEAADDWVQRSDIVLDFVRDQTVELGVRLTEQVLSEKWIEWSWHTFGRRTAGHLVAGAASAVLLGFTLGNLIYGLDDLYNNFLSGERTDQLRLRFRTARLQLQHQARASTPQVFDGELADKFRVAYMLESLAAAQMLRYYADGVIATVRQNLVALINPIAWFRGKEWREAAEELRTMGLEGEEGAEEDIGHPEFVDVAIAMATERLGLGGTLPAVLIDDADQAFLRFGPTAYWQSWPRGHAGSALWTLNESSGTVNSARWVPRSLPQGMYQVEAFVGSHSDELPKPFTRSARYGIKHAGIESSVEVGQNSADGAWLHLGSYYFDGSEEYVELADATGEPSGSTVVMFDAVRWLSVETAEPVFAAGAGDLAFDVVLPGEEARIVLQVLNSGSIPWVGNSIMLSGNAENPAGVPSSLELPGEVAPGSVASWDLVFAVAGEPGIRSVRYQMQHAGEPFGDVITGYIVVLPEELRDLEAEIRNQIEAWMQQGGQAADDLMQAILLRIQEELEQQATNFLESLLSGCTGSGALLSLMAMVLVRRRSRLR